MNTTSGWQDIIGGAMAIFSILSLVTIGMVWNLLWNERIKSPFAGFFEHRRTMQRMKMRAELMKHGSDPEYVDWLERRELGKK